MLPKQTKSNSYHIFLLLSYLIVFLTLNNLNIRFPNGYLFLLDISLKSLRKKALKECFFSKIASEMS